MIRFNAVDSIERCDQIVLRRRKERVAITQCSNRTKGTEQRGIELSENKEIKVGNDSCVSSSIHNGVGIE